MAHAPRTGPSGRAKQASIGSGWLQIADPQPALFAGITSQNPLPPQLATGKHRPFHGGNTGSNPIGDANKSNMLEFGSVLVSNGCPIYKDGRRWTRAKKSPAR